MSIIAAAIAAALTANAQEAPAPVAAKPAKQKQNQPDDSKMQKVEVRGAADAYDPRRDDTASKIVVNHDEIVKHGDTNLLDVLKRVPGVTVSGGAGRGGDIRMRGLGSGYTQILLNGERAPAGFSLDTLAPDAIERIEVLRAASAEYSTQSIAGTINIVLKKAIKTGTRDLKVGYGKGRRISSPTANLLLSDRDGKLSYSVTANLFHSKFDERDESVEQAFDLAGRQTSLRITPQNSQGKMTALSVNPRVNWALEGGDTLTSQSVVNVFRLEQNSSAHTLAEPSNLPAYPDKHTSNTTEAQMFQTELNWVHKLDAGAKLDTKLLATYGKLTNMMDRETGGNADVGELNRQFDTSGSERALKSTGKYTNPLWDGHSLAIGWDGGYNIRDTQRHERDYSHPSKPVSSPDETSTGYVTRLAAYAQDEWSITPRWSVYLGTRWEGIRIRAEGNNFAATHSSSSVLSPIVQTLYKLPDTKADQVRLAVTRTYKAPDLQRLLPYRVTSVNNNPVEPDYQGNPNLKPELALGVDAAYEHYWGQGAMFSVAASTRRITDYTRNLVDFDGSRYVSMPTNNGRAQTHSLEVEAKFPLKSFFDSAPAIDVRANVARNWSRVESVPGPNNRLDQQTPLSANVGLDYKAGALTTGGSFTFKNGGAVRVSDNQTAYVSVKRDLDLYALWKFDPKLQLRVSTANLLGQDNVSESGYISKYTVLRNRTTSQRSPSVRVNLETKF